MAGTITIEEWRAHLSRAVNTGALGKGLRIAAVELAKEGKRHAQFGVTNRSGGLRVRSGRLRGSLQGNVKKTAAGADVLLSAGGGAGRGIVKYARVHEEGRTITAKGKYLAIPIHPSLKTGAHVGKVPGPRSVPDLFFITSKKGNHLLVKSVGKEIEPWYLLRKSVTIDARPYMQPALEHIARLAPAHIARTVRRVLDGP